MVKSEEIIISCLQSSPFTVDDIIELMHASFMEHLDEGLHFTCSTMTAEQFSLKTAKSIVLVAYCEGGHELLGTATVTLRRDSSGSIYGYNEYNAVSPNAKRLGIGSKLLRELECIVLAEGGQYLLSDTAVGARSSVAYHLRNGFRKIGLRSYPSTNYYSYLFRKQLVPSLKWNSSFYLFLRYHFSCFIIKLLYNKNGQPLALRRLIKYLIRK